MRSPDVPKRTTSLPCTADNCGELFPRCGKHSTYTRRKCRCDACYEVNAKYMKGWYSKNRETAIEKQSRYYAENREAAAEWRKRYYAENREAIIEKEKQYQRKNSKKVAERRRRHREANRETLAKKKKLYIAENREAVAARQKRWREANRKTILEKQKRHYAENRETILERNRQWRAENSAACVEIARQWQLANPERHRELRRHADNRRRARMKEVRAIDFTPEQLEQRMAYYGNSCYLKLDCCTGGFDHVDHVKPIAQFGAHMLANLRPACGPCNRRKGGKWPFSAAS
jgi:5-methylcytosine-specific restriction endonuclease McrA